MSSLCPSFSVSVGIPVFGLGFTQKNQLVVAGGGGAGRSGIKNKVSSYRIDVRRKDLEEEASLELSPDEDAPMCLDVHPTDHVVVAGVNQSKDHMERGDNQNCRALSVSETNIDCQQTIKSMASTNADDYQKVVRFSHDGKLVATGATNGEIHVFKYPEFEAHMDKVELEKSEILDVDISDDNAKLACVSRDALRIVRLRGKNAGEIVQTIHASSLEKKQKVEFRSFRHGRGYTKEMAFAVVNGRDRAFVCKFDVYSLEQQKMVKVSNKPITACSLSRDGALLAIATSDLSIILLDALNMRVLTTLKNAHGFSITSIAISADRRLLASGSADNTCRIVSLPVQFPSHSVNPLYTLLLAMIVAGLVLWITTVYNQGTVENSIFLKGGLDDHAEADIPATTVDKYLKVVPSATTHFEPPSTPLFDSREEL
ncbi:quinon protein alcohol dehydrogenase-like superfamily [Radiomyces spectabilis]|uniref:quinon protein alcohol dehydrogenase-like superfamily n=1 Tax=Radiomyces spectabilis TaxID=64574 RepID=UPI0022201DC4|nr:quinon protein alcohol dehydrogenase-like superfamily [Radiomyces spectabilis]KAI8376356.1 quinon protein alcohol dehydrogenase-like superfamily [Radiomyces spectabilis]